MCCFFNMNDCCNSPRQYCRCNNRCNNYCRCNAVRTISFTPITNGITPTTPVNRVIEVAQFTAPTGTVATGSNVLFSTTTFNNSAGDITLGGGGVVTLTPGVYKIDYIVSVTNTTEAAEEVGLTLTVNGTANAPSQSNVTVPAASTETLSNSTIVFVASGGITNVALTNTSTVATDTLEILRANLIVTKLS